MSHPWTRTGLIASLLLVGAVLAGCASSGGGPHPTIDPDVGTATPTGDPGGPAGTSSPTGSSTPTAPSNPAAARCPASFGQVQSAGGPVAPRLTGGGTLGVSAAPRSALVCFYGPMAVASPPSLLWSRTLTAVQAVALVDVVDAKPPGRGDLVGPVNCPNDNGSAAILRFSYAAGPSQDVLVRMSGCQQASSEHSTTLFRPDITRAVLDLHAPVVQN